MQRIERRAKQKTKGSSRPNRGGGRFNRGGGQGRGRTDDRAGGKRGGGGWSASRKGGLDTDKSVDGPSVNSAGHKPHYSKEGRGGSAGRGRGSGQGGASNVKVAMQVLYMSWENQEMVKETLLSLKMDEGLDEVSDESDREGVEDYEDEYDELDYRAEDQYWITDRTLQVQEVQVNDRVAAAAAAARHVPQENVFATKKLQRCGFSSGHCQEALQIMDGDVGAALEYLLNDLFNISLGVGCGDDGIDEKAELDADLLEAREEEKMALQSIYDWAFEERVPNKCWVLSLELPGLAEILDIRSKQGTKTDPQQAKVKKEKEKKLCQFYLKGKCKFKDKCRMSHSLPLEEGGRMADLSHPIYNTLREVEADKKPPFALEIRFPQGCHYPLEPPLVAFSALEDDLPPHTRLNISQFLMGLARDSALDGLPCVFSLVSALEDKDQLQQLLELPPPGLSKPVMVPPTSSGNNIRPLLSLTVEPTPSRNTIRPLLPDMAEQSPSRTKIRPLFPDMAEQNPSQNSNKPLYPQNHGNAGVSKSGTKNHLPSKSDGRDKQTRTTDGATSAEASVNAARSSADGPKSSKRKKDEPVRSATQNEVKKQNKILVDEFKKKQTSRQYKSMQAARQQLPAWEKRAEVTSLIGHSQVVVISGMTGCGKTTQVPQFLLDEALTKGGSFNRNIICTQPRRISAMAVAQRVADERAEKLGRSVGYQIRLESVMSQYTRLLFCTTGIILRRLESDPMLEGVTHIIIDEVHERSEESDFLLMILRNVLDDRPDLKVILMSATLNAELFSDYFGECPVLEIPGRTFPVQEFFLEDALDFTGYCLEEKSIYARFTKKQPRGGGGGGRDSGGAAAGSDQYLTLDDLEEEALLHRLGPIEAAASRVPDMKLNRKQLQLRYPDQKHSTIKTMAQLDLEKLNVNLIIQLLEWLVLGKHEFPRGGAVLIFMPGFAEIQTLYDQLKSTPEFGTRNKSSYKIIPLHSTLSSEEQNAVFNKPPEGVTKIVIATNIAETSITIDDIVFVIDGGRMKEKSFDQTKSMESLETVWVSKANALQRRGRAGRVQEGVCFHLFTSHHFNHFLRKQPIPEILRACLEQLVLKIKMLPVFEETDVEEVLADLIEPPTAKAARGAVQRLTDLGALDENIELTPLGYHVGSLPVDVRIGKLMLFGAIFRCLDSALTIAACLSFKSPFVTPFGLKQEADEKRKEFATGNSDYLTMLNAYKGWSEVKGHHRAYLYCQENFLSIKTLQMLASLKQQYVELLSDIGFVSRGISLRDVERAGKATGTDGVAVITGPEANVNSSNWKVISGMLVAALFPNIVQVLTPDTRYAASSSGAVVRAPNADELKFKTKLDGYVSIHPSSVNFQERNFSSPYLVYHEKVKTTKVYVRDSSMVSVYPLLLFGGGSMSLDLYQGNFILSVDDGWISFKASCPKVAELVRDLRAELDQLLSDKISQPDMDLLTCPRGSRIIHCIVTLISTQ